MPNEIVSRGSPGRAMNPRTSTSTSAVMPEIAVSSPRGHES